MALKLLKDITKTSRLQGTIPSGFKSDDSKGNVELIIAEPLIKHPEIDGLYRAFDPETGWKTWVEYTPPVVAPPAPDPDLVKKRDFEVLTNKIAEAKRLIDLGVLTEVEANLSNLQAQAKVLWQDLNK